MSSNYHTPIANGAAANAATFNAPLSSIDTQVTANAAAISTNTTNIATNVSDIASALALLALGLTPQARLSLSSSLPVSTSDVTAATSVYLHPFNGNYVPIYDGSKWVVRTLSTAINIAVPANTSTVYDVFVYWTGSALALNLEAWSSATARNVALTLQDGVYVKTGATGYRYVGTFRTTTVSGQTEDSKTKRFLWNAYNRHPRSLEIQDATASWVYTTSTYRQARATATNQVEVVIGLSEDIVDLAVIVAAVATSLSYAGIGVDSTTVNSAGLLTPSVTHFSAATARYKGFPGIGYHALNWLEYGGGSGTTTWYGTAGMSGQVMA